MEEFLDWCLETDIPEISIYTLSTENLDRDPRELRHIFNQLKQRALSLLNDERIHAQKVRVRFLGKFHQVPAGVLKAFKKVMDATEAYQEQLINFLVSYGAKYELARSVNKVVEKILRRVEHEAQERVEVTPQMIKEHLLVKDPLDLVIRTGSEHRLSNFMLWQSSYAEMYTTEKLWPAFEREDFYNALDWYAERQRRFGR